MRENFSKIKKKYVWAAIAKSAVCGVAIGLLAVGAVLLALKIAGIPLLLGYYALIGVGAALLGGGLVFLLLRPVDKRIAAQLDKEYSLGERVQTALEYEGQEGAVLEIQRQDAEEKLGSLPKRRFSFAKIWQYVVIGVLALALSFTAFFFPAATVEGNSPFEDERPFGVEQEQMTKLQVLIENIKKSHLEANLITSVVNELEDLSDALVTVNTQGGMRTLVKATIDNVDIIIKGASTHEALVNALTSQKLPELAKTITKAADTYKEITILSFEQTNAFYRQRFSHLPEVLKKPVAAARATLSMTLAEGLSAEIGTAYLSTMSALGESRLSTKDLLYTAFSNYLDGLLEAVGLCGGGDDAAVAARLDTLYSDYTADLSDAMATTAYNLVMNYYIATTLGGDFGVPLPSIDNDDDGSGSESGDNTDPSDDDDEKKNGGGGLGDDEWNYPGDDQVYDPDNDQYVHYGDLLSHYQSIVLEMLERGEISEELAKYILDYFEILSSGQQ